MAAETEPERSSPDGESSDDKADLEEGCDDLGISDFKMMFEQSRIHFRHLETMRSQYLGFYFTVVIVTIGIIIGLAKDIDNDNILRVIFGINVLTFVIALVTYHLFVAIVKFGLALRLHQTVIDSSRRMFKFASSPEFPFEPEHREYVRVGIIEQNVFDVQRSAERIIAIGSFMSLGGLTAETLILCTMHDSIPFWWLIWLSGSMLLVSGYYSYRVYYPVFVRLLWKAS